MNLKFKNTIFFLISLIFSCQKKDILETKKFREILTTLHQCEAYNELKFANQDTLFLNDCKSAALKKANVTEAFFQKTIKYYQAHPKELEKIYDSLIILTENQVVK